MDSGSMDQRVTLQSRSVVKDAMGQDTITWVDVALDRFPDGAPPGVTRLPAADPAQPWPELLDDLRNVVQALRDERGLDLQTAMRALAAPLPRPALALSIEDGLVRTNFKRRAMLGYKLINDEGFKLRLSAGPSYDVLMSVDNTDDNIEWNKGDFNSGSFNIDAALGLDISIFTFEPGVSIGFTDVFDTDEQEFEDFDSRNLTYFLTAGVVFGNGKD